MNARLVQNPKVLFAASLVSMVLGSIHAFSVFLVPLETKFVAPRATISLVYSLGLVFLTVAVLFGPVVYSRLRPTIIYSSVGLLGGAGVCLAGVSDSLVLVFLGYSLVFGVANGLGYGFGLQYAARANPENSGLAMGVVTAAYALGAVIAPYGFELALDVSGVAFSLVFLGALILFASLLSALLVSQSGQPYAEGETEARAAPLASEGLTTLWIAYGAGVAAGLMAIGHAAGIAEAAGLSGWVAAAVIAAFNLLGSLVLGWLSDKYRHNELILSLPLLGGIGLIGLASFPELSILCLGMIGFGYGGTIAVYPAMIAKCFPGNAGPRVYGRVFTAWGAAGLFAPWVAGRIYDLSDSYALALWVAVGLCCVSVIAARKALR